MGFFDRFKKNKNANKKVKRVERKRKAIDKQPDIEESQLALREIAVNSKIDMKGHRLQIQLQISM